MKSLLNIFWVLTATAVLAKDAGVVRVSDFASGTLDGWQPKIFKGKTDYRIVSDQQHAVLEADSSSSASGLIKKQRIDLTLTPYLHWSWKIATGLPGLDEQSKSGDDYAARIYVIASDGIFFWNTKAINYVWSGNSAKGTVWPNAYAGEHAMMTAVRSKGDAVGTWYHEQRNVRQDFRKFFGKDIRYVDAIAVMTDTDDSGRSARAWYGDIYFSARKTPEP